MTSPATTETQLITGEGVVLELRAAPFVLRAAGTVIDLALSVGAFLLIILIGSSPLFAPFLDAATIAILSISALVLCFVVLPTAVETASRGRSLGRLAVGARIVRLDGGAIGFRHAFIRALLGVLELVMTAGGLAAAVGLLTARSQRLGDLVAGTYSRHERMRAPAPVAFGLPPGMEAWAATADVARMPVALGNRIAQFLRQAPELAPAARTARAAELAAEAAPFVAPLPQVPAELMLAGAAVVRRDREYAALRAQRAAADRLDGLTASPPHRYPRG
jgi:uncharacterized RDD family membrane protein YckC